jgi:phage terminase small subunit
MAVLDNPKHEAFAQALAKGCTADEAYQLAGYAENRGNAIRLKANERIQSRLAELQEIAAERVVVTREWVLARLIENAKNTQESNPAASNKALELLGKEIGMFVDRSENVNTNFTISGEPLNEDEWLAEHGSETAH